VFIDLIKETTSKHVIVRFFLFLGSRSFFLLGSSGSTTGSRSTTGSPGGTRRYRCKLGATLGNELFYNQIPLANPFLPVVPIVNLLDLRHQFQPN
jgi:hypothetical protein